MQSQQSMLEISLIYSCETVRLESVSIQHFRSTDEADSMNGATSFLVEGVKLSRGEFDNFLFH